MKKILFSIYSVLSVGYLHAQTPTSAGIIVRFDNDRDTTISGTAQRVFDVLAKGDNNYVSNINYPTTSGVNDNVNGSFQNLAIVFTHTIGGVNNLSVSDFTVYNNSSYGLSVNAGNHPTQYTNTQYGQSAKFEITRTSPYQPDLSTSSYTVLASITYPVSGVGTQIALVDNSSVVDANTYASAAGGPAAFWSNSNSSNNNYYLKITSQNSIVLPITYKYFTAEAKGSNALLNWETVTETNNAYFDVQRSYDGVTFTKIGQVKGSGTTSTAVDYTYTDINPGAKVVYYRLNQVDMDGHAHLSDIKRVLFSGSNSPTIVYPNPSNTGLVNIEFGSNTTKVVIWDMLGRKVNELTKNGTVQLISGSYIAQSLNNDGTTYTNRMSIISQK